jgi:hypothetical protein
MYQFILKAFHKSLRNGNHAQPTGGLLNRHRQARASADTVADPAEVESELRYLAVGLARK